jgi:hypothetical protein
MQFTNVKKTEGAIKNGQSRDTGNIGQKTLKEDKQYRNKHNTENYKDKQQRPHKKWSDPQYS